MKKIAQSLLVVAGLWLLFAPQSGASAAVVTGVVSGDVSLGPNRVRAQASGLTANFGGFGYVGWLINESTDAKLNTGVFANAINDFGTSTVASGGYTLYVITFEPTSNTSNTPQGLPVAKAKLAASASTKLESTISGNADVTDTAVAARTTGLPKLPTGYEYVGWLVNEGSGAKLNVGVLASDGSHGFSGSGLSRAGYSAYVVTYEPAGNRSNDPLGQPVAKAATSFPAAPVTPPRTGDGGLVSSGPQGDAWIILLAVPLMAVLSALFGWLAAAPALRRRP